MSAELPRSASANTIPRSVDRPPRKGPRQRSRWWGRLTLALRVALFVIAILVLRHELSDIDRAALLRALRSYGWARVALGVLCTAASYLTLGCVELLALRYAGRRVARVVPRSAALTTAFVAHAFSQSVGLGLLTGAAVRLRVYARYGVDVVAVARASAFVTATVILGLLSLGAVALLNAPGALHVIHVAIPGRSVGVLMATVVLAYMAWTGLGKRAALGHGRWRVPHPSLTLAAAQVLLSATDWLVTGTVLFALLPAGLSLSYAELLRAYLVAQVVGMASHVPGGAGVFEVALLGLLAPGVPNSMRGGLVASLVAYRALYYFVPLCAATVVAAVAEVRRTRGIGSSSPPLPSERVKPLPLRTRARYASPRTVGAPYEPVRAVDAPVPRAGAEHQRSEHHGEHHVEWLIDNAEAYAGVLRAIRAARQSVWISQLAFDADCVFYASEAGHERAGAPAVNRDTILAETLLAVAANAPVDIRILLNATILLNTARPLRRFFTEKVRAQGTMAGRIRVRGVRRFPNFLHLKMVIVDGRQAFLLGSPFVNSYWDDARHPPVDTRRPMRELSGRPLHDVSLRVAGGAVRCLERVFAELWDEARPHATAGTGDGAAEPPSRVHSGRAPQSEAVRVVRTMPRRVLSHAPGGVTDILDALLDGIDRARSLIYIEHQYLTARPVVAALVSALDRRPELELVIVLNQNPDLTAYRGWQNARLEESGLLEHPRAGVFTLWSAAPSERRAGVTALNQVFVHSKVVTVDDAWAMVGAANLDGLSLHSYGDDFTGRLARWIFRHVRNFEVSVVVRDEVQRTPGRGTVADLRTRLWSEHLALPARTLARRPLRGWLHLWRARAGANVAALSGGADLVGGHPRMHGFALPYSTRLTPVRQLADLGVRVDPARLDVRYDPGWLEAHFSPGWVRNMFE
ncbi:MAG TPA: phospholipase D-like domain-containing protein [Gemmatimonadaceae bacterium]|nr:phospholipase D-like domain-containing protein [Gemmatimonadaceae bacterium]